MTPERKHQLNKLLAEVVGKTVHEDMVEVHGHNGVTKELALVDENQFLWDQVDDANDAEVVEEAVLNELPSIQYKKYPGKWNVRMHGNGAVISKLDPCKRVAFALAVEQWWEAKKGQA